MLRGTRVLDVGTLFKNIRAVLLDRDGVVNMDSEEFIKSPEEWKVLPGVVEAIGPSVQTTGADTRVIYQGDVIVGRLAYGAGAVRVGVAGAFRNV